MKLVKGSWKNEIMSFVDKLGRTKIAKICSGQSTFLHTS
jgi:hypothetical protein